MLKLNNKTIENKKYKVKLTYFKKSGKFYSEGEYITSKKNMYDIIDEVEFMKEINDLPNIIICGNDIIIHIYSEDIPFPFPHIIV